jgi:putative spermidine/putrescine transport system permease protein
VAEASRSTPSGGASAFFYRHPGLKLGVLLGSPMAWFVVVYLGSLVILLISAFWYFDGFTGQVFHQFTFSNFHKLLHEPVYRAVTFRTAGIAAEVTLTDIAIAFPLAYYAARMATPRSRNAILLAVVVPLWANYLVRVFAWKLILTPSGLLDWVTKGLHLGALNIGSSQWAVWITFVYLWLPFTMLPIYGALERVPESLLEASGDLGARGWVTFRRVLFPMIVPGLVAGSIFSFSLTLGDYITPALVGKTQFIGNVIYNNVGVAGNVPLAAAFTLVPIAIMTCYLLIARQLGAFEAL